ncbi:hypothetical protein E5K00_05045 [Hymenobacter aquaticus]|uniref:Uncharacterized protein n=1 Tax=Hymenobacter aquaticus TaxID=1867101 RepID=A0A4Z0Q792_9BACT|nr:hypothetical protein [Hymenobacter aquaticus]TGE24582.1 hypothetical protein E5K00_05045 [Hymenobacter aquaticus]
MRWLPYSRSYAQKIRNPRRRIRQLPDLQPAPAPLDLAALQQVHYEYKKLGLGVWHWPARHPPRLIRQLAATHLLNTFFAWDAQLQNLGQPYYLSLQLVSPDFAHSSQVIAGLHERIAFYQTALGEPVADAPPLPPEYRELPAVRQLHWTAHPHEQWLDSFDCPSGWPARYLRRPHRFFTAEDGEEYLVVRMGWVWVGQLPK